MLVGLNEAMPQGAVEALVSPVLLGTGGEDKEAAQTQAVEISREFSPVVGEQGEDGQDPQQPTEELGGAFGVALGERHSALQRDDGARGHLFLRSDRENAK